MSTNGTLSAVSDEGNEYWATLSPPAGETGPATITVQANGVPLNTQPTVTISPSFPGPGGGIGGCPLDGNLRVRVDDEAENPLAGAQVLLGQSEVLSLFQSEWNAAPDGNNTATSFHRSHYVLKRRR